MCDLNLFLGQGLVQFEFLAVVLGCDLREETRDLVVFLANRLVLPEQSLLELFFRLRRPESLFSLLLAVQFSDAPRHLGVEFRAFHLVQDKSIVGFIDVERLSAVGADKFVHDTVFYLYKFNNIPLKS